MKAKKVKTQTEFDLFLKEIKALKISTNPYLPGGMGRDSKEPAIAEYWRTGGVSGGSCWDTGDNDDQFYDMESEPEPEFESLDKILEHFAPNVTFLQYKRLIQDCVERGDHRENEYYGNHTNYAYKIIKLEALFKYMKGLGWLK